MIVEAAIQVNSERRWLYAAVGSKMNKFLHVQLFSTRTTQLTILFLQELQQHSPVTKAMILVNDTHHLKAPLSRFDFRFQIGRNGVRNAVEHIFRKVKRVPFCFQICLIIRSRQRHNSGSKPSLSGGAF